MSRVSLIRNPVPDPVAGVMPGTEALVQLITKEGSVVEEVMLYPGMKHRFWAEETDFRMLVVCFGEWTAEDQTRHEDDYGREGQKLEL